MVKGQGGQVIKTKPPRIKSIIPALEGAAGHGQQKGHRDRVPPRITVRLRIHTPQAVNAGVKTGLLENFPHYGRLNRLPIVHKATGKGPLAPEGITVTLNKDDVPTFNDDAVHGEAWVAHDLQ